MKKEKIAVYSLTAILFFLMMLAYWLLKLNPRDPYELGMAVLFMLLLARSGGNIVLLFFGNKISVEFFAGIMAILLFSVLVIRLETFSVSIVLLYAQVATIVIMYALFKKRAHTIILNVIKILASGFLAFVFYLSFLYMIEKSNPGCLPNDAGVNFFYLIVAMGIGIIELIVLTISYERHKNEAKVAEKA